MKKSPAFSVSRTILVLFSPVIFLGLLFIALQQSPTIGLVVLLSTATVQLILSAKFNKIFSWKKPDTSHFKKKYFSVNGIRIVKLVHISFNLSKVLIVFSVLKLIYLNFGKIHLNKPGVVIVSIIILVFTLLLCFEKKLSAYQKFVKFLSTLVYFSILVFSYLYFGLQVIWLLFAVTIVWELMINDFKKIKDDFAELNISRYLRFPLAVFIIAVVSTLSQFRESIVNSIDRFVEKIFTLDSWCSLIILGVLSMIILGYFTFEIVNNYRSKKEEKANDLRFQEERRINYEKRKKEIQELKEKHEKIRLSLENNLITKEELLYLAKEKNGIRFEYSCGFLDNLNWENFVTVSKIKKQIVWDYKELEDVLTFLNYLYSRTYTDKDLQLIKDSLKRLRQLSLFNQDFKGSLELINFIKKGAPDIK